MFSKYSIRQMQLFQVQISSRNSAETCRGKSSIWVFPRKPFLQQYVLQTAFFFYQISSKYDNFSSPGTMNVACQIYKCLFQLLCSMNLPSLHYGFSSQISPSQLPDHLFGSSTWFSVPGSCQFTPQWGSNTLTAAGVKCIFYPTFLTWCMCSS